MAAPPMIDPSGHTIRCVHDSCKKPAVKIAGGDWKHKEFGAWQHDCCGRHDTRGGNRGYRDNKQD
jgi:hypothetical protein